MGLFTFESAEERARKAKEFQEKILPLGIEQKEMALKALRPLIKGKVADSEIVFAFLVTKQKYMEAKGQPLKEAEEHLGKQKHLSKEEKECILALVLLDIETKSLDAYPTAADVKAKASQWQ